MHRRAAGVRYTDAIRGDWRRRMISAKYKEKRSLFIMILPGSFDGMHYFATAELR